MIRPNSIYYDFRPNLRHNIETLDQDVIRKEMDMWLKNIKTESSSSIENLLSKYIALKGIKKLI